MVHHYVIRAAIKKRPLSFGRFYDLRSQATEAEGLIHKCLVFINATKWVD